MSDQPYRILVTGSRAWPEHLARFVHAKILEHAVRRPDPGATDVHIIEGECPYGGVDQYARECGEQAGYAVKPHPAKSGGFLRRNSLMVALTATGPGVCLAFPLSGSTGTRDCYTKAIGAGIETHIYPIAVAERWAVDRG